MPCALLTDELLTLRNLPRLAAVDSFGHLLNQLGVATSVEGARPEDFGHIVDGRVTDPRFTSLITAAYVTTCNAVANQEVSKQIVTEGVRR